MNNCPVKVIFVFSLLFNFDAVYAETVEHDFFTTGVQSSDPLLTGLTSVLGSFSYDNGALAVGTWGPTFFAPGSTVYLPLSDLSGDASGNAFSAAAGVVIVGDEKAPICPASCLPPSDFFLTAWSDNVAAGSFNGFSYAGMELVGVTFRWWEGGGDIGVADFLDDQSLPSVLPPSTGGILGLGFQDAGGGSHSVSFFVTVTPIIPADSNISFNGTLVNIDFDHGGAVYSGVPVGTNFFGSINRLTSEGFISDGTTLTQFDPGYGPGYGLEVENDVILDAEDAAFLNALSSTNFVAGDLVDVISIEGNSDPAGRGLLVFGLVYVLDPDAFDNDSRNNYPPDTNDILIPIFFVDEENNEEGPDIFASSGVVSSVPGFDSVASLADLNSNGSPEIAVAMPGSTHVQIRDGSTDVLITDIDFGNDLAFDMAVLPDLNSSGNPEIAILNQQASGQVRVQIRDSVTGGVTSNLWYGLQYEPVSMTVVPDYNSSGFPEIAVLGSEAGTDAVRVQIQDSSTGTFLDNVFLGTQSIATDLVAVADTSGNGIPEMGIMGVLKANDQVRMQMWDADTATFQSNVWFAKVYQPHSTITMPDINSNGSDEIVAMGVDPITNNIRVQVRDSATTATLYNIWLGAVNEAVDIALINDINSNGFDDLAVLLKTPGGTGRVRVQDGGNGAFIRNLFYTVVENPVGLAVMPDYNGNSFDELAVLGEFIVPSGVTLIHVQILDTSTGVQVNRIDFP